MRLSLHTTTMYAVVLDLQIVFHSDAVCLILQIMRFSIAAVVDKLINYV